MIDMKLYLKDYDKATKYGICIKCEGRVSWGMQALKYHKKKCIDTEFQEHLREMGVSDDPQTRADGIKRERFDRGKVYLELFRAKTLRPNNIDPMNFI